MEYEFSKSRNIYAITLLEEFFDYYGLAPALGYTETLLSCAMDRKYYSDRAPYAMVSLAEWLRKLIPAAVILEAVTGLQDAFEVKPGGDGLPDLSRKEEFIPGLLQEEWTYLPRYVTAQQYLNPMLALKKLRKYKTEAGWMKAIDELQEYALSGSGIDECCPSYNIMRLRLHLLQAIEACHLLLVRYKLYKNGRFFSASFPHPLTAETETT